MFPHLPVQKDRILRSWIKREKEERKTEEKQKRRKKEEKKKKALTWKNRTRRRSAFPPRPTEEPVVRTCLHASVILFGDGNDHKATLLCS